MNASVTTGLHRLIEGAYEATYERVHVVLKAAGFDILSEMNMAEFFVKKSQSHIRPFRIVVVCNAEIAHHALTIAPEVGVMLPTHVAVMQTQDGQVEVRITDPHLTWNAAANPYLRPIIEELTAQLERVLDALKS